MWASLLSNLWPSAEGSDEKHFSEPSEPAPEPSSKTTPKLEPAPEPGSSAPTTAPQLDLTFMCDCTGSMSSYIRAAQQNISSIVERVAKSEGADVRFALVAYRDHPPQESSYITEVYAFTSEVSVMKGYVNTMSAAGGGDGPEAVTAALHDALHLPWRPGATKVAVLIADAPPHGLEPDGDGFPNGDPLGRDPLTIAREMAALGIACYTVGCEPALGMYHFARDFMCTLAEITGGQAVALGSAALLADVIVNGSAEEISLTHLQSEVEEEIGFVQQAAEAHSELIDVAETVRRATVNLQSKNVRSKQMRTDGAMLNSNHDIWHAKETSTLMAAKAKLCKNARVESCVCASAPAPSAIRRGGFGKGGFGKGGYGGGGGSASWRAECVEMPQAEASLSTMNVLREDLVSEEQVHRTLMKSMHKASRSLP
mmetsp:Transcript_41190/g.86171  ORF Transcript_41190/g.86171 Transcript_41190/m.86171 type:complete len:427 (-) Transcript_41190:76-1356(-)